MWTRIIEDKPSLSELYHHGVLGQKWGVRKNRSSGGSGKDSASIRNSVISKTEKELEKAVREYGTQEAYERVDSYAYDDSVKILKGLKGLYGSDFKKWSKEQINEVSDLESELLERYETKIDNYSRKINR